MIQVFLSSCFTTTKGTQHRGAGKESDRRIGGGRKDPSGGPETLRTREGRGAGPLPVVGQHIVRSGTLHRRFLPTGGTCSGNGKEEEQAIRDKAIEPHKTPTKPSFLTFHGASTVRASSLSDHFPVSNQDFFASLVRHLARHPTLAPRTNLRKNVCGARVRRKMSVVAALSLSFPMHY